MADTSLGKSKRWAWDILSYQPAMNLPKNTRVLSKDLRSQMEEASSGQSLGNLSINENKYCNESKYIKHI